MLQVTKNAVRVYVTAHTLAERDSWVEHFSTLFGGCTTVDSNGLWKGIAESSVSVEHVSFDDNFVAWLGRVFYEVGVYMIGAQQAAALVEVRLDGIWTSYYVESPEDCNEAAELIMGEYVGRLPLLSL